MEEFEDTLMLLFLVKWKLNLGFINSFSCTSVLSSSLRRGKGEFIVVHLIYGFFSIHLQI